MPTDCVFCKIVQGELPCTRVYEDDTVLAFLDIGPIIKGHTLVIPKEHVDPIMDVSPGVLHRLIDVVQRIAIAQTVGLGAEGINVAQANGSVAGQLVPHLHFHVIPRFASDGHSWNWNAKQYTVPEEMSEIATKIKNGLQAATGVVA